MNYLRRYRRAGYIDTSASHALDVFWAWSAHCQGVCGLEELEWIHEGMKRVWEQAAHGRFMHIWITGTQLLRAASPFSSLPGGSSEIQGYHLVPLELGQRKVSVSCLLMELQAYLPGDT